MLAKRKVTGSAAAATLVSDVSAANARAHRRIAHDHTSSACYAAGPMIVDAVIPALDEEEALPGVLRELSATVVRRVVVVDNGSRDRTVERARAGGAHVAAEAHRGYGAACLRGIAECRAHTPLPDVIVFLDADGSDDPAELDRLLQPIAAGRAELVIGSRVIPGAAVERGALSPQARAGNLVATWLIRALYGVVHTDLGPFRAITLDALERLDMRDRDWGWTAEMQVKAIRRGVALVEVPASWRRRRGGRSKISGTVKGVIGAGYKILTTIARHVRK
jgi:glycosyltransferase involved in cell wall biosynthesis